MQTKQADTRSVQIQMYQKLRLNHFCVGNKDIRYILTTIGIGITIFALVRLSTDICTALFGVEGVNAKMQKPNP